jgi:hypothetical protein
MVHPSLQPKDLPGKVIPLAKGEIRQELHNTWVMLGLIGLKWRAIVRRKLRS